MILNTLLTAAACFFGGTLILALAFVLARGKAASYRHLVFTGAFAVLLALPLVCALLPSQMVWHLAAPQAAAHAAAAPAAAAPSGIDLGTILAALVCVWALGVVFLLSKALFGAVVLMDLYRASVPHIPSGLNGEKFRGLKWQLRLRTTPGDAGPITFGLFKPIVLLPKTSVTWPRERLEAVLLHEAAHVRRMDCLTRLVAILACALYWPNPFVWAASRAMRRDCETAADDCVLSSGMKASAYAGHLVNLARAFHRSRPAYASVSLAMAEPAMLDARVEAILNPMRSRKGVNKSDVLKIAALGLTATAVMALVRPSLAEAPTPEDRKVTVVADRIVMRNTAHPGKATRTVIKTDAAHPGAVQIEVSDADEDPAAPEAPPAPEAPSAPVIPTPAIPAVPAAPAIQAAPAVPAAAPAKPVIIRVSHGGQTKEWRWDGHALDAETRAEINAAAADFAASYYDMEAAAAEIKAHQSEIKAAQRAAQEELRRNGKEIAKAQDTIREAMAKVNIPAIISKALAKARVSVKQSASHVEVHVDTDDDTGAGTDKDN